MKHKAGYSKLDTLLIKYQQKIPIRAIAPVSTGTRSVKI